VRACVKRRKAFETKKPEGKVGFALAEKALGLEEQETKIKGLRE
jgi:hypothetical protein